MVVRQPSGQPGDRLARPSQRFAEGCHCNRATLELMDACGFPQHAHPAAWRAMPPIIRSLVAWQQLPPALKESNRRFADSIASKVERMGGRIVPLDPGRADRALALAPQTLEELARTEHDRWVRDLEREGWRPTRGAKDPEAKLHPLLVPWEQLPEDEREKHREPVRALPALLRDAGFAIVDC